MTEEQKEKILKKVKKPAGIPDSVTVYDERIEDLIQDAILEMRTGGVSKAVMDEASASVIATIAVYVRSGLDGDVGDVQSEAKRLKMFKDRVLKLSLTPDGETLEGLV